MGTRSLRDFCLAFVRLSPTVGKKHRYFNDGAIQVNEKTRSVRVEFLYRHINLGISTLCDFSLYIYRTLCVNPGVRQSKILKTH